MVVLPLPLVPLQAQGAADVTVDAQSSGKNMNGYRAFQLQFVPSEIEAIATAYNANPRGLYDIISCSIYSNPDIDNKHVDVGNGCRENHGEHTRVKKVEERDAVPL